jgi:copper chaperone
MIPAGASEGGEMSDTKTYTVPGIHCGHCADSIKEEVSSIEGVEAVDVDLAAKVVTIRGEVLSDVALREAIEEAGYQAA